MNSFEEKMREKTQTLTDEMINILTTEFDKRYNLLKDPEIDKLYKEVVRPLYVDRYILELQSPDKDVRRRAVCHLGEFSDPRAINPLAEIAKNPHEDSAIREKAGNSLRRMIINIFHIEISDEILEQVVTPIEKRDVLDRMEKILKIAIEDFADEINRQNFFIGFKSQVNALWKTCEDEDSYFAVILSLLDDTLHLSKSNNVTLSQLNALLKVVNIMRNIELKPEDLIRCETILRDSGLKTVPEIEGIADIYTSEESL